MENNKGLALNFSISEKSERIIELEKHPEFKKLPYHQQIILLTGEKLLQIDQKLRTQTSFLNDFILQYGNAINDLANNQKNIDNFVKELVKQETIKLTNELKENGAIPSVDEQKIVDLIQEKYNEEISNMESRIEYATKETIKNFDESIFDTLEKVDNLKQFEIKAREEIQKSQDRIYLIEEEIARQKEINETLQKSFENRLKELNENHRKLSDENSSILNYKYYDSRFDTIEELESFIKAEAKSIAKEEVEKYIHDYNLFSEDRNDELIEKLFEEGQLKDSEVNKVYQLQMENNNKMSDLEHLLDEQNRQIKLLSEDRQNLVLTLSELLKDKDVDVSKVLEALPFKNFDDEIIYKEKNNIPNAYDVNASNLLNNNEMEILVKKQAIELVKEKIAILNKKKANANLKEINSLNIENDDVKKYFDEANKKIQVLENQLKEQLKENDNLKNDLFDEISKNNIETQNNELMNKNSDSIIEDIEYIDFENMSDEELMKHNYYNGSTPIPGTKITRINNYKINNDLNSSNFSNDAHNLIKKDIERLSKKDVEKLVQQEVSANNSAWQENNQKLVDLENLISRQDEEIKRLKNTNEPKPVKYDNSTLNNIDESIKTALKHLQELASAQEKTKQEIEETNKKIYDLESQLRRSSNNDAQEELARKELDKIMEEKYRTNANNDVNYSEEIRKIEAERRRIEETLELERIRLLSEIEANRKKLNDTSNEEPVVEKPTPVVVAPVEEVKPAPVVEEKAQPKEEVHVILEAPKKKRKQQFFFEVKTHSTPKLTRADLEK